MATLREMRLAAGLSIGQAAAVAGVSYEGWRKWEHGYRKEPRLAKRVIGLYILGFPEPSGWMRVVLGLSSDVHLTTTIRNRLRERRVGMTPPQPNRRRTKGSVVTPVSEFIRRELERQRLSA